MNQIPPYQLWVGHAGDGRAAETILAQGIRAVVQLALEEPPLQLPREFIYLRFPLLDGSGNDTALLRLAIDGVAKLVEAGIPTLVCCGGGMSRSPAIVAAALAIVERTGLNETLGRVLRSHPGDVSPGLWAEVCRLASAKIV